MAQVQKQVTPVDWKHESQVKIGLTKEQEKAIEMCKTAGLSVPVSGNMTGFKTSYNQDKGTIRLEILVNGKTQVIYPYADVLTCLVNNADVVKQVLNSTLDKARAEK